MNGENLKILWSSWLPRFCVKFQSRGADDDTKLQRKKVIWYIAWATVGEVKRSRCGYQQNWRYYGSSTRCGRKVSASFARRTRSRSNFHNLAHVRNHSSRCLHFRNYVFTFTLHFRNLREAPASGMRHVKLAGLKFKTGREVSSCVTPKNSICCWILMPRELINITKRAFYIVSLALHSRRWQTRN